MESDFDVENEEQFWEEIEDTVSTPCRSHERIDDTLRTWLSLVTTYRETYVQDENAFSRCALALLASDLFTKNDGYVRRQLVEGILQNEAAYEVLASESLFSRLVNLVRENTDDDTGLHRLLLELLYEMSRMQQLSWEELTTVDDAFILYLLQILETISNDVHDPYHSPVIRVLLVINEQYMLSSTRSSSSATPPLPNRLLKMLSMHSSLKSFGESLILLLNREVETSLQLLILKTLYLLFTTPQTHEYFYTNDLYVLTDILLRNVLDLPHDSASTTNLRHTYLRVLHPLLSNTQLREPPHYKRPDVRRALWVLDRESLHAAGSHDGATAETASSRPADQGASVTPTEPLMSRHFEAPDATTVRLVRRCLEVEWLRDDPVPEPLDSSATATAPAAAAPASVVENLAGGDGDRPSPGAGADDEQQQQHQEEEEQQQQQLNSASSGSAAGQGHGLTARRAVGNGVAPALEASQSSLSLSEVAGQREKPGVITPSKGLAAASAAAAAAGGRNDKGPGGSGVGVGVGEGIGMGVGVRADRSPFEDPG